MRPELGFVHVMIAALSTGELSDENVCSYMKLWANVDCRMKPRVESDYPIGCITSVHRTDKRSRQVSFLVERVQ